MRAERLDANPLLTVDSHPSLGGNVNGPSVVRAPPWVADPLGEYYLYFAHHQGQHVRLAYADDPAGPWTVHPPGTLRRAETDFDHHVASPDVHLDPDAERVRMYYHGCCLPIEDEHGTATQHTRLAVSGDGLDFESRDQPLGRFYFRVFDHGGERYALAKENRGPEQGQSGLALYRDPGNGGRWEKGPLLAEGGTRHCAVRVDGDALDLFYSRIGDRPERILHATVDLGPPWREWEASAGATLLEPREPYEGIDQPLRPSTAGADHDPVRELRDPAYVRADGEEFLFYTVAGEQGIAAARLRD
jgi:hypothetical protein